MLGIVSYLSSSITLPHPQHTYTFWVFKQKSGLHSTPYNFKYEFFSPGSSADKEFACNAGDPGSFPGLGSSPGEGHGNPLQYSCLENPHGQGSLMGYSPWGRKESDMTVWLSTHSTHEFIDLCLFLYFTCFIFQASRNYSELHTHNFFFSVKLHIFLIQVQSEMSHKEISLRNSLGFPFNSANIPLTFTFE